MAHSHHVLEKIHTETRQGPDRTAVIFAKRDISYAELTARSLSLAQGLANQGIGKNDLVGISLNRSPDMVASIMAVWQLGAAYLPLDPEFPAARLKFMREDSGCKLIISDQSGSGMVEPEQLIENDGPDLPVTSGDMAYMMYTSGSTGNPKGVVNGHSQLGNFLNSMSKQPGCGPNDCLLAVTTLSFDISLLELFLPLWSGGSVILPDKDEATDGAALIRLMETHDATIMQGTPATFRLLLDAGWKGSQNITALCGGEALTPSFAEKLLPKVRSLWNMYGPTETTVWSTISPVTSADEITIGKPIDQTRIHIVNEEGERCEIDEEGEIWIGGEGVALGYHARDQLTAERFLNDPFCEGQRVYRTGDRGRMTAQGDIIHLGRLDNQLKIRGFRIEAGDIEAALLAHEDIEQAVCIIQEMGADEKALVAYFTVEGLYAPTGTELRRQLRETLPSYMIPQYFVELGTMPLTPNGKVDRQNLPHPASRQQRKAMTPPRTDIEKQLASIWSDILEVEEISLSDNFFELGGQSLQTAQVIARFHETTGLRLDPASVIFQTLEQISASVTGK